MSTITKEDVINATMSESIDIDLIKEYCIEHGKDNDMIDKLIMVLAVIPTKLMQYYMVALEYYQCKFNISLIHEKEGGRLITAF